MQVLLFLAAGDSQAHLSSRQSSHPCSRRAAEFRSVQRLGQFLGAQPPYQHLATTGRFVFLDIQG